MPRTKELIVDLSYEACSIIIIGVGLDAFEAMNELDGETLIRLSDDNGRRCMRDIVQFVRFNDVQKRGVLGVAAEVLAEVPEAVVTHYLRVGYKPVP